MIERRLVFPLMAAFVFSIPWEKSLIIPGIGTVTRLLGALVLVASLAAVSRRRFIRPPNLALVWASLFVLWVASTSFWTIAPSETMDRTITFAQLAVMLWLIWEFCRTPGQQLALLRAYVGGAAVASVLTLVRYARGLQTYYRRYAAAGFDPNDLGLTVALCIPMALYLALRGERLERWACRAAIVLATWAVLLSASRTGLTVSIVAFAFVPWTWRESDLSQKVSGLVLFSLLLTGGLWLAPHASRQRLASLPKEAVHGTLHGRTRIWKTGAKVFRGHPVLGVGAGAYPEAVRPWLGTPALEGHQYVAHNTYLSVLVECGFIGFSLFALLLGTLAVYVWIIPSVERALWSVVLAVWALGVTTLTWEHRKPGWLLFGLIMTEWVRSFRVPEGSK